MFYHSLDLLYFCQSGLGLDNLVSLFKKALGNHVCFCMSFPKYVPPPVPEDKTSMVYHINIHFSLHIIFVKLMVGGETHEHLKEL